jgi:transposase InsO family protein
LVKQLAQDYPVAVVCRVFDIARSSFYHKRVARVPEADLKAQIAQLCGQHPTYGYRRITALLHRAGQRVNNKRVRRIMAEMGLCGKAVQKRCRTTNSNHSLPRYPNRVMGMPVERPDQLWVAELTYIKLGGEFVYLAVVMDVFSRSIRGWQLGRSMEGELTLIALKRALRRGKPENHHSDQGVQYAAREYTQLLEKRGIAISNSPAGIQERPR